VHRFDRETVTFLYGQWHRPWLEKVPYRKDHIVWLSWIWRVNESIIRRTGEYSGVGIVGGAGVKTVLTRGSDV
jgi:hypothetical protein